MFRYLDLQLYMLLLVFFWKVEKVSVYNFRMTNKEYSQAFFKKFDAGLTTLNKEWRFMKMRFTEQLDKTDDLKDQNEKLTLKIQILNKKITELEKENKTLNDSLKCKTKQFDVLKNENHATELKVRSLQTKLESLTKTNSQVKQVLSGIKRRSSNWNYSKAPKRPKIPLHQIIFRREIYNGQYQMKICGE